MTITRYDFQSDWPSGSGGGGGAQASETGEFVDFDDHEAAVKSAAATAAAAEAEAIAKMCGGDYSPLAPLIRARHGHTWGQVGECLNGPHLWKCANCNEWTRSYDRPKRDAMLIDPDRGTVYESSPSKCEPRVRK